MVINQGWQPGEGIEQTPLTSMTRALSAFAVHGEMGELPAGRTQNRQWASCVLNFVSATDMAIANAVNPTETAGLSL